MATKEYSQWFSRLDQESRESILSGVYLLREYGPTLGRPHADTLKASRIKNLKELRVQSKGHVYRIAFVFGRKRVGILLVGDDKRGRPQKLFYRQFVAAAEQLYDQYSKEMAKETEGE